MDEEDIMEEKEQEGNETQTTLKKRKGREGRTFLDAGGRN
jgi:hypothetical protein